MFLSTNKCEGIGKCIEECPTEAIRLINGKAFSCITCGACYRACPNQAIFKNKYGGYVIDRAKCNGCGVCKFTCPVNSIHFDGDIVKGICARCGLCVDTCPNNSRIDGFDLFEEKQINFLESLNLVIPHKRTNIVELAETSRNCILTHTEDCIRCGRCQYYCPTNAIIVQTDEKNVCTECRVCTDLCPADAISNSIINHDKCVLCLSCLKNCPSNAITESDFKVTINHSETEITGTIVSCLNCGLCVLNDKGDSLKLVNGKIRFDSSLYNNGDLDESIAKCPVSTLKKVDSNVGVKVEIEGYCVSCGKCVKSCDIQEARKFEKVIWNGEVKDSCISCGTCVEFCPVDAILLKHGTIEVNHEKCILCESCAIHCPKDAIPTSTMYKQLPVSGFNTIDSKFCINCKMCYKICPEEAIIDHGDHVSVDMDKCIFCSACSNACPAKAFIFEREFESNRRFDQDQLDQSDNSVR
ncbi:4Fe-4S binding protein [Methanobrevibacter filiformis]|uniref:Ferredoxin-2 n=1 Tax=Methanobrevibacter filiformis TaxID=55758 RepID=A0A166C0I2_9EURY|nr:4Fe-4S binding protein [Methanobrevibacter filiformis]KZX14003.1 ferredoxin-2 [Methanobrevibacter filiformis]